MGTFNISWRCKTRRGMGKLFGYMPSTSTESAHAKSNADHRWELGYPSFLCA